MKSNKIHDKQAALWYSEQKENNGRHAFMNCRIDKTEMMPDVWMLTDRMGMHMTLLVGKEKALLVDTGYGFDDITAAIRQITPLPFDVVLTHGHHDHACGAFQFEKVWMHRTEEAVFTFYAGSWRRRVWQQATAKGLDLSDWTEEAFVNTPCGQAAFLKEGEIALGGLTAQILHCPGHTSGSLCVYVKERQLLLPGDNMNPTTWIFFPECEGLGTLTDSLEKAAALPFEQVLCPHDNRLLSRADFEAFRNGLTMENVLATSEQAFHLWEGKKVFSCHPQPHYTLCYDFDKLPGEWKAACRTLSND